MDIPHNIIFLDIDGCVTSLADNTYFNPDPAKYHPSKKIVDLLKTFCIEHDAKIIISSNWRKFDIDGIWKNGSDEYKNPLSTLIKILGSLYYDTLPKIRHVTKSQALIYWFEQTKFDGNFAIFDDDINENYASTLEYGIAQHYVHVDHTHGITSQNLKSAERILKLK